jgi:hypothetical protein
MHRIIVLLSVVVLGAAGPARAWCEAACLAPEHGTAAHCPSHDPAGPATSISATSIDECPALESARQAAPGRADAHTGVVASHAAAPKTSAIHAPALTGCRSATTVFERSTPLRI